MKTKIEQMREALQACLPLLKCYDGGPWLEARALVERALEPEHVRTFRLDRLYNQFLKPKGLPLNTLPFLVSKLYEAGFIEVFRDPTSELERYSETEKLTGRQHRDELFKIVGSL